MKDTWPTYHPSLCPDVGRIPYPPVRIRLRHSPPAQRWNSIGDDAYYTAIGNSATLSVKKGSIGFNVAVRSADVPIDQQKSLEKDLAQQILSKL